MKRTLILLVSLMSLLPLTQAARVEVLEFLLDDSVEVSGAVRVEANETSFVALLPEDHEGLFVSGGVSYEVVEAQNAQYKYLKVSSGTETLVRFSYKTKQFLKHLNNRLVFEARLYVTPWQTEVVLRFPEGLEVIEEDCLVAGEDFLGHYPKDVGLVKEQRTLKLYPMKEEVDLKCTYKLRSELPLVLVVMAGLGLGVACSLALLLTRKKPKAGLNESVLNVLEEKEKRIVELLAERGEVAQAFIQKQTGIPKATLSKILKGLEERNIINRVREGRSYWVRLKDWIFKKRPEELSGGKLGHEERFRTKRGG